MNIPHSQAVIEWLIKANLATSPTICPGADWNGFFSNEPPNPDLSITVYDTPAEGLKYAMNLDDPTWEAIAFQVRVRARDYNTAWNRLRSIALSLTNHQSAKTGGLPFQGIFISGSPVVLPEDQNRRIVLVQNFRAALSLPC